MDKHLDRSMPSLMERNRGSLSPYGPPRIVRLPADELLRRRLSCRQTAQKIRRLYAGHAQALESLPCVLLLSDVDGWLLEWFGPDPHLASVAHIGITPGCSLTEDCIGHWSMPVSLQEGNLAWVAGSDHFLTALHGWTSISSPIRSHEPMQIEGTITAIVFTPAASPFAIAWVASLSSLLDRRDHEPAAPPLPWTTRERRGGSGTGSPMDSSQSVDDILTLAAAVAHEIRNPLTTARGFLQLFLGRTSADKDREFLRLTLDEIDRVTSLLNDFMSLTKPDTTDFTQVNLSAVADAVGQLMASEAALLGIDFEADVHSNVQVWGNPSQLKQVILNILQNGLQACENHGHVSLAVFGTSDRATIVIQDDGVGMNPEQLDRIFQPFYTTKATGTGMGMAVSRQIVEAHGGELRVESDVGHGTSVTITLTRMALPGSVQ